VDKIEFTDLTTRRERKGSGGVKVACQEFKQEGNTVHMKVNITRTEMSREMFRTLFGGHLQRRKVRQRRRQAPASQRRRRGGDDGLNYTLDCKLRNDAGQAVKLIWEITTRTEEIDLPFEFQDLPLP